MEPKVPRSGLNPIDGHVGSRVRMRRLMLKMSQSDLADGLGLTFQQVQKYEKGTNRIGASRLQHISQILQVPVPFFFDRAPGQSGATVEIAEDTSYRRGRAPLTPLTGPLGLWRVGPLRVAAWAAWDRAARSAPG